MRKIPQAALYFTKPLERAVLRAYDDKNPDRILKPGDTVEGTLTAGAGHTGPDVLIGMDVTDALSDQWLWDDLTKAAQGLSAKVGDQVLNELTEHQYVALLDFVLNLGTGDPSKPEWTIWKRLRAREFDQIPIEMARFVNWDGHKSNGLVNRRNAEIAEWSIEEPGAQPTNPPSSATRVEPTPPTPTEPKPPSKSGVLITGAAGAVASAGPMVHQATQAIQPYAPQSSIVRNTLGILAAVGAVLAVVSLVLVYLSRKRTQQ